MKTFFLGYNFENIVKYIVIKLKVKQKCILLAKRSSNKLDIYIFMCALNINTNL